MYTVKNLKSIKRHLVKLTIPPIPVSETASFLPRGITVTFSWETSRELISIFYIGEHIGIYSFYVSEAHHNAVLVSYFFFFPSLNNSSW